MIQFNSSILRSDKDVYHFRSGDDLLEDKYGNPHQPRPRETSDSSGDVGVANLEILIPKERHKFSGDVGTANLEGMKKVIKKS